MSCGWVGGRQQVKRSKHIPPSPAPTKHSSPATCLFVRPSLSVRTPHLCPRPFHGLSVPASTSHHAFLPRLQDLSMIYKPYQDHIQCNLSMAPHLRKALHCIPLHHKHAATTWQHVGLKLNCELVNAGLGRWRQHGAGCKENLSSTTTLSKMWSARGHCTAVMCVCQPPFYATLLQSTACGCVCAGVSSKPCRHFNVY